MTKISAKSVSYWFTVVLLVMLGLLSAGALWTVCPLTLINYWLWFGVLLVLGAVSAAPCRRFWTWLCGGGRTLCMILHTVAFTLILSAALLSWNYLGADKSGLPREEATIVRKYSETHYHSRRVGRRSYARGAPYKVYKVELEFSDGLRRDFRIQLKRSRNLHKGDTVEAGRGPGALGMPVLVYPIKSRQKS